MTTKEMLLQLFETHKGSYFSGEEIASALDISRAAVWKAVNALRKEGYAIQAVTNRGYCLPADTDVLSARGIGRYLRQEGIDITVLPSVGSTNDLVRRMASEGRPEGCLVAAGNQTAGKGRSGREFYSPGDTGVYFSLLLRPRNYGAREAVRITTMAAAAMCLTLEALGVRKPGIKWVNDIFVDGKKVCGILTEGSFSMETGMLEYAVLGVGVNVYAPGAGFPEVLRDIAGGAFRKPGEDLKNRLTAEFLNRFLEFYRGNGEYTRIYRDYSIVIGREVEVLTDGEAKRARVLGIDDECRLELQWEDGTTQCLSYGEIRIRL